MPVGVGAADVDFGAVGVGVGAVGVGVAGGVGVGVAVADDVVVVVVVVADAAVAKDAVAMTTAVADATKNPERRCCMTEVRSLMWWLFRVTLKTQEPGAACRRRYATAAAESAPVLGLTFPRRAGHLAPRATTTTATMSRTGTDMPC